MTSNKTTNSVLYLWGHDSSQLFITIDIESVHLFTIKLNNNSDVLVFRHEKICNIGTHKQDQKHREHNQLAEELLNHLFSLVLLLVYSIDNPLSTP